MYSKILILFTFLFGFSTNAQMQYFDVKGNKITEQEYEKIRRKGDQLKVYNDSLQISKVIPTRSAAGEINSIEFITKLEKNLGIEINTKHPTIIEFYPGKDACNSTSTSVKDLASVQLYNETEANKVTTTNFINIYKDKEGIKTLDYLVWYKDPNQMVEKTFFVDHYPCSSFVILYNNKYRSYFGEFSTKELTKQLKEIVSSSNPK